MQKLLCLFAAAFMMLTAAAEAVLTPQIVWSGYKGKAVAAPSVSSVKGPDGKSAVRIEAQSDSKYQGALGTFEPLVDFSKYSAVEFYIRHNIHTRKGGCSMVFMAKGPQGNIHCQFVTPSPNWSKVSIPLDRSSFAAQRGNSVNLTMMETMRIYPFANMDKKGKFLEIADFKLIPKTTSTQKIKVMSYKHTAVPTSGEKGNTLTDGDKTYYTSVDSLPGAADFPMICTVPKGWYSARYLRAASPGAWVRRLMSLAGKTMKNRIWSR